MSGHATHRAQRMGVVLLAALGVVAVLAAPAAAGSRPGGGPRCDRLVAQGFERIGERVMGRMLGSPQAHEAMDRVMAQMMGAANEERMHEVMGERFSGCGNPALPGGYGGMMGAMGMMGGFPSGPGGRGALGPGGPHGAPGSMMGFTGRDGKGRDDDDVPVGWMIAMMLVLVGGAAAVAFVIARPRRGHGDPRDLLARRFAGGEIDADEYRRRSELLEGGRR